MNLLIPGPVDVIEPQTELPNLDLPRIDELVSVVGDHLRGDVMESTEGRTRFLSRVASNALDIVQRELAVGEVHRRLERERLAALLGEDAELEALRWRLVESLRSGELALDAPGLAEHLRATVVNQVAIDQPRYSGYLAAAEQSSVAPG